jgi:hypothetical protein
MWKARKDLPKCEIMTRFTNDKSCGCLAPGEHLAERDWVIGSEVRKCSKSLIPARRRQRPSHHPGGLKVVDKTQSHSQAAGQQDFRVFRPNKSFRFVLLSVLTSAKLARGGFVHLLAHQKRWPPDSYRGCHFLPSNVRWAGLQGLASCEKMTADCVIG